MYLFLKRILDIVLALTVLILASPLLIPVVILLKLTGEGYIFYLQERVGYKNKLFPIYKFATMLKDSPNIGTGDITVKNDPRVTPMGPFLRKSKLNELPQIINVLKGDMSIVGPRPLMPVSFKMYKEEHAGKVYNSKPGITGIGSLIFRDEETMITKAMDNGIEGRVFYQNEIYPYKGKLEMWYQENKSIYTDVMIIFLTAWSILFSKTTLPFKIFRDLPEKPASLKV